MEWRVIEYRDETSWSEGGGPDSSQSLSGTGSGLGLVNYLFAGLGLVATGILAVFAFSFVMLVVVPLAVVAGGVFWWRWRRVLKAAQREHLRQREANEPQMGRTVRPSANSVNKGDVIDV